MSLLSYNYVYQRVRRCQTHFSREEFRCTIRVDEPCPVCSPRIDLSSNGPGLDHRGEPGVSDANNERNTFGVYGGGGGARINVCLTKPVWVLGLTIYIIICCRPDLDAAEVFDPEPLFVYTCAYTYIKSVCDGETPIGPYHGRSINIMYSFI